MTLISQDWELKKKVTNAIFPQKPTQCLEAIANMTSWNSMFIIDIHNAWQGEDTYYRMCAINRLVSVTLSLGLLIQPSP